MRKSKSAVFASLLLVVRAAASDESLYFGGDLAFGSTPEGSVHAMLGIRNILDSPMVLELASGWTTSRIALPDGRIYWSAQPVWLPVGALAGFAGGILVALPLNDPKPIPVGLVYGWIAAQIVTNSEMRLGTKYLSAIGAQQVDWLVPGWHPREKLSLGVQLGNAVAFRAMGTRSISSIDELNHYGTEFRLVWNFYGM